MPELLYLRREEENWSGIADPKIRRKLQNRLNIRAYRMRKAHPAGSGTHNQSDSSTRTWPSNEPSDSQSPEGTCSSLVHLPPNSEEFYVERRPVLCGRGEVVAPNLSGDQLIPVAQFNIVRAFTTNALILDILKLCPPLDCKPWRTAIPLFPNPYLSTLTDGKTSLPLALRYTEIQANTPHELWIDIIPDPMLRDNIITHLAGRSYEKADLLRDILGHVCPAAVEQLLRERPDLTPEEYDEFMDDHRDNGMIVWDDPWSVEGYELTIGFIRKWRFLLTGSHDLLASTNKWRVIRGEKPLQITL